MAGAGATSEARGYQQAHPGPTLPLYPTPAITQLATYGSCTWGWRGGPCTSTGNTGKPSVPLLSVSPAGEGQHPLRVACIGAGYVGGPAMSVIAYKASMRRHGCQALEGG
jgi:hypothetical protein